LEQAYANIRYSIACPNERDCNNKGAYAEHIPRDVIDDDTGEYISRDYDIDYSQCQFCYENKSSIFNGGTVGEFDGTGIIENLKQGDMSSFKLRLNHEEVESYNDIKKMHGKRIAVFEQTETIGKPGDKTLIYKFHRQGRCIGKYIFNIKGERHTINLDTFIHIYYPVVILTTNADLQITLNLRFS